MSIRLDSIKDFYVREGQEHSLGTRQIHRFIRKSSDAEKTCDSIYSLMDNNPQLIFVNKSSTNPLARPLLRDLVKSCRYLVINGNALCLTDKDKAPAGVDRLCIDTFFSEALVVEPVRCSKKHVFEKKYIEAWVNQKKDNQCPYEGHPVGPIVENLYLKEEIRSLIKRYETYNSNNKEITQSLALIEKRNENQIARFNDIVRTIDYSEEVFLKLLDLNAKEQVMALKKMALERPIDDLKEIIKKMPQDTFDEILDRVGFNLSDHHILIERFKRLQVIENNSNVPPSTNCLGQFQKTVEILNSIFAHFVPQGPVESSMIANNSISMIFQVFADPVVAAIAAVGIFVLPKLNKHLNRLPSEIPPSHNISLRARTSIPLIGRDEVIRQIYQCWSATCKTVRQHPLLLGPSRAGKTSIIQEIARRIALFPEQQDVPESLKNSYVFQCNAGELLVSHFIEGNKFLSFFKKVSEVKDQVIIAIDEVHTFMLEANKHKYKDMLKSVLDTSDTGIPYMIFATTTEEYHNYILKEAPLANRFFPIKVDYLDENYTIAALHQQILYEHPGLLYESEILKYIYDTSSKLGEKFSKKQPEIAKQVLSQAYVKMQNQTPSSQLFVDKERELASLNAHQPYHTETRLGEDESNFKRSIVENEIVKIQKKLKIEKEKAENYKPIIKKIIDGMSVLINLANDLSLSKEEERYFMFFSKFYIPELFLCKTEIEKDLNIRPLDKHLVDSVIHEFEINFA